MTTGLYRHFAPYVSVNVKNYLVTPVIESILIPRLAKYIGSLCVVFRNVDGHKSFISLLLLAKLSI